MNLGGPGRRRLGQSCRNDPSPRDPGRGPLVRRPGEPLRNRGAIYRRGARAPCRSVFGHTTQSTSSRPAGRLHLLLAQRVADSHLLSLRQGQPFSRQFRGSGGAYLNMLALAPVAWLMAQMYVAAGWWAVLLFAVPLYTTRLAYSRFVEVREMFTETVTEPGRGRRQARHVHQRPQPPRPGDRHGHRAGDEGAATTNWRRWSGAACCTTSARSACPTRCCSSRSA